jgi:2-amino-4-hydroxy-6-hydroxymethyldihydropteridine diphosphokinase
MNKTWLLLGSNMGNSKKQLADAIRQIKKNIGHVARCSKLYATAAWGNTNQPDFLNQVVVVHTKLSGAATISRILKIEKEMGRVRTVKNAPRIIDIDILFFNKEIISVENLTVPHPQIQNRRFVLVPMNELNPSMKHPVFGKTIHRLLLECPDKLDVKKF